MKSILFILLFIPFLSKTQEQLKYVFLAESDHSLIAYVIDTNKITLDLTKNLNSNIDSILIEDFRFEYDWPTGGPVDSVTRAFCDCDIYINELEIEKILKSSKLKFYYLNYGYSALPISESLSDKFGVNVMNMGCIMDHEFDNYRSKVEFLLKLRNGEKWKQQYSSRVVANI